MITYNGTDLRSLITVMEVEGRGTPSQEVAAKTIGSRNGSYFQRRRLAARILRVKYMIKGTTDADLRSNIDNLNGILNVDQPGTIVFADDPGKTYRGILNGSADLDEVRTIGVGTMEFFCADPFKYAAERSVALANTTTITNGGNHATSMIVDVAFTTAASEFKITNAAGKYVRVIRDFVLNDKLMIDFGRRLVTINGVTSMAALDLNSEFFELAPGSNTLTITPASSASGSIKLTERWI